MKLTPEQIKNYNEKHNHCPYCNSTNISSGRCDMDGSEGRARVTCDHCDKEWWDLWQFSGMEEIQDQGDDDLDEDDDDDASFGLDEDDWDQAGLGLPEHW